MSNLDFRLQLRSHKELFTDRETAVKYITKYFIPDSLVGEPTVYFYGDTDEPSMILAIGAGDRRAALIDIDETNETVSSLETVSETIQTNLAEAVSNIEGIIKSAGFTFDNNKKENKVSYEPDTKDELIGESETLAAAISAISEYVQANFKATKLTVSNTESITLTYVTNSDGGMTLSSDVNISTYGDSDTSLSNDNILGIKSDGLYATVDVDFDSEKNELTFVTSGVVDGKFMDDANKKVISLGAHTEYTADNEDHNVAVTIDGATHKISADVKLSEESNNLLSIVDGKLMAEAKAKNIKYKSTTVYEGIDALETSVDTLTDDVDVLKDTVEKITTINHFEGDTTDTLVTTVEKEENGGFKFSGAVRLGSGNSIILKNGGIEADIEITSDLTNNVLNVRVGNSTTTVDLPVVDILEESYYDATSKTLVLMFSNGTTVKIPMQDLIDIYKFENTTSSPVVFNMSVDEEGTTTVTTSFRLASTDNMLSINSIGELIAPLSTVTNAVATETTRAEAAEAENKTSIETEITRATTAENTLSEAITVETDRAKEAESTLTTNLTAETTRAKTAETELQTNINTLDTRVTTNETDIDTLQTKVDTLEKGLTAETTRAEAVEADLQNQIKINDNDIDTINTNISTLQSSISENAADIDKLEAVDIKLNTAIEDEMKRATAAETVLTDNLTAEVTRAKEAEATLQNNIDTLTNSLATTNATVANNTSAIASEQEERKVQDTALDGRLSTAESRLIIIEGGEDTVGSIAYSVSHAVSDVTAVINNEIEARKTADTKLQEAIETLSANTTENISTSFQTAKDYSDNQLTLAKTELTSSIATAKQEAITTSATDATTKADAALASAKEYTDTEIAKVTTTTGTISSEITALQEKDAEIETELAKKVETVTIERNSQSDLQYYLLVDGVQVSEINIPKDQFLKSVEYLSGEKTLRFVFETSAGDVTTDISVADLVDTYTAGNGLSLADNQFSVKKDSASETYLEVSADGVKVTGIDAALTLKANVADVYVKTEIDTQVAALETEIATKVNSSDVYTKTEVDAKDATVQTGVDTNAAAIAIINGNYAQDGSIQKALYDAKAYTDTQVATETTRATAAEQANAAAIAIINGNSAQEGSVLNAIKQSNDYTDNSIATVNTTIISLKTELTDSIATKANASDVYTKVEIDSKGYLTSDSIANLATTTALEAEVIRAKAAEETNANNITSLQTSVTTNASDIDKLEDEVTRLNLSTTETSSMTLTSSKSDTGTTLSGNVKLDLTTANIIKLGSNGLYATAEMAYDKTTHTISFTTGNGTSSFVLASHSLVTNAYYDSANKQLVLIITKEDESTEEIRINVSDLVNTWIIDNGTHNPIELTKTTNSEGVEVLSATLDISTESHNAILNNNGTLYASKLATEMIGLWGGVETSLQVIIENLKSETDKIDGLETDVETLQTDMTTVKADVATVKTDIAEVELSVATNTANIAKNEGSITTLSTQVSELSGTITTLSTKVDELDATVTAYETRVSALESGMTTINENIESINSSIEAIREEIGTEDPTKGTVYERLDAIEATLNSLIDFGNY